MDDPGNYDTMTDASRTSLSQLYEISRNMVASLDLKEVISRVLTNSARYVGAERGMLVVLDENLAPEMAAVLYRGRLKPTGKDDLDDILRAGLAGWVVREQKIALIPDTSQDARWLRRTDDDITKSGANEKTV